MGEFCLLLRKLKENLISEKSLVQPSPHEPSKREEMGCYLPVAGFVSAGVLFERAMVVIVERNQFLQLVSAAIFFGPLTKEKKQL